MDETTLVSSVDLVAQAQKHINFLRNLHINGITLSKPSHESFRRYTDLWLPFVKKYSINSETPHELVPPPDIAWLWHCHRLAPYRYAKYVEKRFFSTNDDQVINGESSDNKKMIKILDASPPFTFQNKIKKFSTFSESTHDKICKLTIELYHELYPNESFFLDKSKQVVLEPGSRNTKLDGFDVVESCDRQATFLWQVSGPNFSNETFLSQGVENYTKFVRLIIKRDRPQFLVPTYQIDLMWHTHMLSSIELYHADIMNATGKILEHDDSLNDRTEGGTLENNFQATRKLWSDVYGVEYKVAGGMYRGEPPVDFFKADWPEKMLRGGASGDMYGVDYKVAGGMYRGEPPVDFFKADWPEIGQVEASSHVRTVWKSMDDAYSFKLANPRSTLPRDNANAMIWGYIFGKGEKGIGYYSLDCRDTYDILIKRIDKMIASKKQEKYVSSAFLCLTIIGILCIPRLLKFSNNEIEDLQDAKLLATARRDSANPSAALSLPKEVEEQMMRHRRNKADEAGGDAGGYYYNDDHSYYSNAAACGAGGGYYDGGGGGGGGMGGDAGAGCGGGGCGGGGCGGGGGG